MLKTRFTETFGVKHPIVGLIHDVPTVKELVERIVREAEAIIRGRLAAFAAG